MMRYKDAAQELAEHMLKTYEDEGLFDIGRAIRVAMKTQKGADRKRLGLPTSNPSRAKGGTPSLSCPEPGCDYTVLGREGTSRDFMSMHQRRAHGG